MDFSYIYIPVGVPTFHLESAQREFEKSIALLKSVDENLIYPENMLLSLDSLKAFLKSKKCDLAVVQNVTFANSAYISQVTRYLDCPVLLWTLREPVVDGTRLRLNSLTGAFSAGNAMTMLGKNYTYLFASPEEERAKEKLTCVIKAAKVKKALSELTLLQIGHTPQGFGFGRAEDCEMQKHFGVTLQSIEAGELMEKAKAVTDEQARAYLIDADSKTVGLEKTETKNRLDFARLYKVYSEYCKENNIGAVASRCWPDFFVSFGTPVCAVLSMLCDMGIPAACEADSYGALSMFVAYRLTNSPAFFGDPVSLNEEENTLTFWHCGTAACSLAREDTGALVGVHCNRKIGPTLEFGCKKSEKATVIRFGKKSYGSFRCFICSGEILDKPQQFYGTSLVFKAQSDVRSLTEKAVCDGWEPHFAVAYGDIAASVEELCKMLSVEVVKY